MRGFLALAMLGLVAGAAGEPLVLDDPVGDVERYPPGGVWPLQAGLEAWDLLEVRIWEPDDFHLTLETTLVDPNEPDDGSGATRSVFLYCDFLGERCGVQFTPGKCQGTYCALFRQNDAGAWIRTIPRHEFPSDGIHPLGKGAELTNTHAYTTGNYLNGLVSDWVGDPALPGATYKLERGAESRGGLVLFAESPLAYSNGDAATHVFSVTATNEGDEFVVANLEATDVPSEFNITLPASLSLGPGQSKELPVIMEVPFNHKHGVIKSFWIEASSADAYASLPLGVDWLEIPQLSGHHDRLYAHAAECNRIPYLPYQRDCNTAQVGWSNVAEEDPRNPGGDAPLAARPVPVGYDPLTGRMDWPLLLQPGMLMGLDFDLARDAAGHVAMTMPMGAKNVRVETQLVLCLPGNESNFAPLGPCWSTADQIIPLVTSSIDVEPDGDGRVAFDPDLQVLPVADDVPLRDGMNIVFHILVEWDKTIPTDDPPMLITSEMYLDLPLFEYKSPVANAASGNGLLVVGDLNRFVNPGRSTVVSFEASNRGENASTMQFTFLGVAGKWARAPPPVSIDGGESKTINVHFDVPLGTPTGIAYDVVAAMAPEGRFEDAATARFAFLAVDPGEREVPDQVIKEPAKASPSAAFLVLGGVAAAAWTRRRI